MRSWLRKLAWDCREMAASSDDVVNSALVAFVDYAQGDLAKWTRH